MRKPSVESTDLNKSEVVILGMERDGNRNKENFHFRKTVSFPSINRVTNEYSSSNCFDPLIVRRLLL